MTSYTIWDSHTSAVPEDLHHLVKLGVDVNRAGGKILEATPKNVTRLMSENGISKAVIWSIPRTTQQTRMANEWTASVVKMYPDLFVGFASVQPVDYDTAVSELEYAVEHLGLRGLKVHPRNQGFAIDDARFLKLVSRLAEEDLPLVLHIDKALGPNDRGNPFLVHPSCSPNLLPRLIEVYDSPKVMCAHMGGVLVEDVASSKVTFQTCGASTWVIEEACRRVGSDRIIFGSDYPDCEFASEIMKVTDASISEADKQQILCGTLRSVLL